MPKQRSWVDKLLRRTSQKDVPWLHKIITGSLYRLSDIKSETSLKDIRTQIQAMRAYAKDSQVSTALSYYATDSTLLNTAGQMIWATPKTEGDKEAANIVNELFKRWDINTYARDHILELATIGNLYIPTTQMFRQESSNVSRKQVAIDNNTIPDIDFDIVPSYKIPPEDIVHIYQMGQPQGYIYQPEDDLSLTAYYPETAVIHFSLGGLLGNYTIDTKNEDGLIETYDIKFAQPMLENGIQPTQTLSLLEDALILSSLIRTVKFVNVECGNTEEDEVDRILEDIKACIEQQMSLDTGNGTVESFLNPQSPNNLIYLPKINGADAISITDLNMSDATAEDSKLLDYYQNKKLSVLGIPKEYLNFSSNEGLGGAGNVLSQRSALYANMLQRLKTAYMEGWKQAINTYFTERGLSGLVDTYDLHMAEIITTQSTITFEKRDAAVSQAQNIIDLLKNLGVTDADTYKHAITEVLTEVLPVTGGDVTKWDVNVTEPEGGSSDGF